MLWQSWTSQLSRPAKKVTESVPGIGKPKMNKIHLHSRGEGRGLTDKSRVSLQLYAPDTLGCYGRDIPVRMRVPARFSGGNRRYLGRGREQMKIECTPTRRHEIGCMSWSKRRKVPENLNRELIISKKNAAGFWAELSICQAVLWALLCVSSFDPHNNPVIFHIS